MQSDFDQIICIHGGAGAHKPGTEKLVANALKGCKGSFIQAIMALESDPTFNCGFGSNLTITGKVECEASYMSSNKLAYGAVACPNH
uniref:Asparaginase n=1 Tax=Ditylenchus dipsaci TaxID=166011 RepID=A0A915E212_9BILA